jgi:hypothetical protein
MRKISLLLVALFVLGSAFTLAGCRGYCHPCCDPCKMCPDRTCCRDVCPPKRVKRACPCPSPCSPCCP